MKALYLKTHVANIAELDLGAVEQPMPVTSADECLIQVAASGVNPSDALATTGYFHHANLPRIPGRDFAGTVVVGPKQWLHKRVWGTGGAAGISFDGTQAEYIKLTTAELAEVPHNLDLIAAGAQALPYVTAYYSLVKRARMVAGETVLVVGALGQVGRAAMAICHWLQCHAIALVRGKQQVLQAEELGWKAINSEDSDLQQKILTVNNNRPVHIILNSVGNTYWQNFLSVLAEFGRIVTIGARENFRAATINLFELYRANQDLIGINTVPLSFSENANLLNELKVGFEENKLSSLTEDQMTVYNVEQANQAYQAVIQKVGKRVVLKFN